MFSFHEKKPGYMAKVTGPQPTNAANLSSQIVTLVTKLDTVLHGIDHSLSFHPASESIMTPGKLEKWQTFC